MNRQHSAIRNKVLVISNDPADRQLITSGDEHGWHGLDIEFVSEGLDAGSKLLAGCYDLAAIDGVQTNPPFIELAENAFNANTPVLVLSGDPELTAQLQSAGFPHLVRPFGIDDLANATQSTISGFRENMRSAKASLDIAKARLSWLAAASPQSQPPLRSGILKTQQEAGCGPCRNAATLPPFTMAFQPIIDLAGQTVDAHEALVRGPGGEAAQQLFAALAPEARYAFDQACRVKAIEMASKLGVNCDLHINFMPNAIYEPVACLRPTLVASRRFNFPAERLVFEVVEEREITDAGHLARIFSEHRRHNFKLALDDFGTGFSGLFRLAELAPDIIKLDRALIAGCNLDTRRLEIVASIATLCNRLGVKLIAEGVETADEMAALRKVGVNFMQGFYLARPAFQELVIKDHIAFGSNE
jgi:EAL domain-containing protein (putative c-di-GMP-specific phosphodiesterase class I)